MSSSEVSYKWIIQVLDGGAKVVASDWDGKTLEEIDPQDFASIKADRDIDGAPIIRRIGSGYLAQHYRFEREIEEVAA
jgi:hypothetical protein